MVYEVTYSCPADARAVTSVFPAAYTCQARGPVLDAGPFRPASGSIYGLPTAAANAMSKVGRVDAMSDLVPWLHS